MPRILGVDVPNNKRLAYALRYIYGIGPTISAEIIKALNLDESRRARDLTDDEVSLIAQHIQENYIVEGQLRRQTAQNIARLRDIHSYRGLRHRMGLPVRGQRTKTNARTRKGPRRTVAVKRGVKDAQRK